MTLASVAPSAWVSGGFCFKEAVRGCTARAATRASPGHTTDNQCAGGLYTQCDSQAHSRTIQPGASELHGHTHDTILVLRAQIRPSRTRRGSPVTEPARRLAVRDEGGGEEPVVGSHIVPTERRTQELLTVMRVQSQLKWKMHIIYTVTTPLGVNSRNDLKTLQFQVIPGNHS